MKFKEWARIYYETEYQDGEPDKEYYDGLKDRIASRLAMVLQINEWDDDKVKKGNRKKAVYLSANKEIYDECEDAENNYEEGLEEIKDIRKSILELKEEQKSLEEDLDKDQKCSAAILKKQCKLNNEIRAYEGEIEKIRKNLLKNFESDYMIYILRNVSKQEGEFYKLLLNMIPADSNPQSVYQCLKRDEWWRVQIEDRIAILEKLLSLMEDNKWYFVRERYSEIAEKIIHPHEYKLLRAAVDLIEEMYEERHALYSYGEEDMFCRANKGDGKVPQTQDVVLRIPKIDHQPQYDEEHVRVRYRYELKGDDLFDGNSCDEEQTNLGYYNLDGGNMYDGQINLEYNSMIEERFKKVEDIIKQINDYTSEMKNNRDESADVTNFERGLVSCILKTAAESHKEVVTEENAKSILQQLRE